jgi:hypothetical protein
MNRKAPEVLKTRWSELRSPQFQAEIVHRSAESLLDKIKHITSKNLFEKETVIVEGKMHEIRQGHCMDEFDQHPFRVHASSNLSSEAGCSTHKQKQCHSASIAEESQSDRIHLAFLRPDLKSSLLFILILVLNDLILFSIFSFNRFSAFNSYEDTQRS